MDLNKEVYFALIGDIVDSRKIENRNDVQKKFIRIINDINIKFTHDIVSNFIITQGDSFQGLLKKSNNIMNIIEEIEDSMAPCNLRFGIGFGIISTTIIPDNSSLIDGPAYHNARFAIDKVKDNKTDDTANIAVCSNNTVLDDLINTSLILCNIIKSSWSDKQKIVIDYTFKDKKSQVEIAKLLSIRQPSVNSRLQSSKIYTYRDAIKNITNAFALYLGEE